MSEHVLEILAGDRAGEVISLARDRITLGRRPNNDIPVKDEKASGQHAELVQEGGAWVLRDLESTNGTFMDGRKVTEVGLSSGDVFQIGLTKFCFRLASDPSRAVAAAEGGEEFALRRVDQAQLQRVRKKGGTLGLVAALVIAAGAGAWVWFTFGAEARDTRRQARTVVSIPGNLLAAEISGCEADAGWMLGAGGTSFALGSPAHSGSSALTATRGEGAAFALARLTEPVRVLGEEPLRVLGHARAEGGASVALRLRFSSSREADTLALTAGTSPSAADDWTPIDAAFAVPPGMDRVQVEVFALLPSADASVSVDDLGLVKGGDAKPLSLTAKNGVRLLGSGASAAVMIGEDVLVTGLRPLASPGTPLAAADAAGFVSLADAGLSLGATLADDRFTLTVEGGSGFGFEFPSPGGLLARAAADAAFAPAGEDLDQAVTEVLLGAGTSRLAVTFATPVAVRGARTPRGWRLSAPSAATATLVVAFEAERREARDRVRDARAEMLAQRPGAALATLTQVVDKYPHDDATLGEAQQVRAEILTELNARLDQLERDADTARFFQARSGLVRVQADLAAILAAYGEANVVRKDLIERVRTSAADMLATLDAQAIAERADGLRKLAEAFDANGNAPLATLINDYLTKHGDKN